VTDPIHAVSIVVGTALFQRPALAALAGATGGAIIIVPVLAGLSEMAGQSFVLVVRRVRLPQAIASYGLTALAHVGGVAAWTGVALLLSRFSHAGQVLPALTFAVVAACYAPRLLGVLTIAPYYGELLGRALDAWTMACIGWGLFAVAAVPLPAAMLCAGVGWAANHIIRHFGGYLSAPIQDRLGLGGATNA